MLPLLVGDEADQASNQFIVLDPVERHKVNVTTKLEPEQVTSLNQLKKDFKHIFKVKKPSWAYSKGWPWTAQSIARARHALPFMTLPCGWATPETDIRPFQGWPASRAGGLP
jgi:hypothetical protein